MHMLSQQEGVVIKAIFTNETLPNILFYCHSFQTDNYEVLICYKYSYNKALLYAELK